MFKKQETKQKGEGKNIQENVVSNTKTNGQNGQNVEYNDPENSRFDRSRSGLVGSRRFSSCSDELDTSIREKGESVGLQGQKSHLRMLGSCGSWISPAQG